MGILDAPTYSRAQVDRLIRDAVADAPDPGDVGYDIVPILGQSNAVGRGVGIDTTYRDGPHPRVQQFANLSSDYPDEVVTALDPLWHQAKPGQTVGFPLTFAKRYVQTAPSNRTVLLVPCARGDTGFSSTGTYTWRVGQTGPINLYDLAVAQIGKALALPGKNRVVCTLWHQGEANTGGSPTTYRSNLLAVIDDLRTRYGASMPFVLGQMSPAKIAEDAGYAAVDAVHREMPALREHVGMWKAAPLYNSTTDTVHFSGAGQRINGQTAYAAYELAQTKGGGIADAAVLR